MKDLDLTEIKHIILEERSRPKIPENCLGEIAQIIRMCLKEDPENRPKFEDILTYLTRITVSRTSK